MQLELLIEFRKKNKALSELKICCYFQAEQLSLVVQLVQKMALVDGYLNHQIPLEFLATY